MRKKPDPPQRRQVRPHPKEPVRLSGQAGLFPLRTEKARLTEQDHASVRRKSFPRRTGGPALKHPGTDSFAPQPVPAARKASFPCSDLPEKNAFRIRSDENRARKNAPWRYRALCSAAKRKYRHVPRHRCARCRQECFRSLRSVPRTTYPPAARRPAPHPYR